MIKIHIIINRLMVTNVTKKIF